MFENSPEQNSKQLTLWPGAFPVSPSALRDGDEEPQMSGGSGPSSPESSAYYDPASSLWKTYQVCLVEEWETFSETWPPSGTMRNGKAYPRPPLVPRTSVIESSSLRTPDGGFWRTPYAGMGERGPKSPENYYRSIKRGKQVFLAEQVRMWPTPRAQSSTGTGPTRLGHKEDLQTRVGGQLNPTWVEWLMGFPAEWTASDR